MAGSSGVADLAADALFPGHLYAAGAAAGMDALPSQSRLRSFVPDQRASLAGFGRESQTPRCLSGHARHTTHLEPDPHLSSAPSLPGARRRLECGPAPVGPRQRQIPLAGLPPERSLPPSLLSSAPKTPSPGAAPLVRQNLETTVGGPRPAGRLRPAGAALFEPLRFQNRHRQPPPRTALRRTRAQIGRASCRERV